MERRVALVELDLGRLDRQLPAVRHRVAGVDREVDQHLLDLARVGSDRAEALLQQVTSSMSSPISRRSILSVSRTTVVQADDARLEHLLAAESQELPRQVGSALAGLLDLGQLDPHRVLRLQASGGELRVAQDGREQVVEIVRDASRQPPHRFHLLGVAELFFELPPSGEVHQVVAMQLSSVAIEHRDADEDREPGARPCVRAPSPRGSGAGLAGAAPPPPCRERGTRSSGVDFSQRPHLRRGAPRACTRTCPRLAARLPRGGGHVRIAIGAFSIERNRRGAGSAAPLLRP